MLQQTTANGAPPAPVPAVQEQPAAGGTTTGIRARLGRLLRRRRARVIALDASAAAVDHQSAADRLASVVMRSESGRVEAEILAMREDIAALYGQLAALAGAMAELANPTAEAPTPVGALRGAVAGVIADLAAAEQHVDDLLDAIDVALTAADSAPGPDVAAALAPLRAARERVLSAG